MKNYRETYIRKAEVAQLILLHQLYSLSGSRELIFQGVRHSGGAMAGAGFLRTLIL